jgi:hypothetical protein
MNLYENQAIRQFIKKYVGKDKLPYKFLETPYFFRRADTKQLKSLHNKYSGQRCFIIGNGPSLNKCDLTKLANEQSFAVNGIFYKTRDMGYKPTFYVVEDSHVMKDNVESINEYDVEHKFFPIDYKGYVSNKKNVSFFKMNTGFYQETSPNFCIPRFSTDCADQVYCGQSVTMINLQLAYYLGFTEVYLIGMDFSYKIPDSATVIGNDIISNEDDENHFHPDYFGKGKTWHDPHLDRALNSYKMINLIYEAAGRKVINATIGGKLEIFDRVDYDSLFKKITKT